MSFLLLSILAISCCGPSFPISTQYCIESSNPSRTVHVTRLPADGFREQLALELRRSDKVCQLYLDTLGCPFSTEIEDSSMVRVVLTTDTERLETLASCLEGGQRLCLNDDALTFIRQALDQERSCTVEVGNQRRTFPPGGFHL